MQLKIDSLSTEKVFHLISTLDYDMAARMSRYLDLKEYSSKLSKYARFIVLYSNEIIVGMLAFYDNSVNKELYVSYLCTSYSYRKQGVAKLLMNKLIDLAISMRYGVALEVNKTNMAAISLYENVGFKISEERDETFLMKYGI